MNRTAQLSAVPAPEDPPFSESPPSAELPETTRVLEALSGLAKLLERSINEVRSMDTSFQDQLCKTVQETTTAIQGQALQHLEMVLAETRKSLEEQYNRRIEELSLEWETERNRLTAELTAIQEAARASEPERAALAESVNALKAEAAQSEAERNRLNAEVTTLQEAHRASETERVALAESVNALKAEAAAAAQAGENMMWVRSDVVNEEIQRLESQIQEITTLMDDPDLELSAVIRKNGERAQHECYLRGIRFVLGSQKPDA